MKKNSGSFLCLDRHGAGSDELRGTAEVLYWQVCSETKTRIKRRLFLSENLCSVTKNTPIYLKIRVLQIEVAELGPFKHAASRGHSFTRRYVKGTVSQDFLLQVFPWIILPQASKNNIRVISNMLKNLRRYLQVKVHYRCQQHRRQILPPVPLLFKLFSGIVDAGDKIIKTFLNEDFFHLPLGSTTPVVHLELVISPQIFEKIWKGSNGILRGFGKTDSWKTWS
jgi:hypothetical protein